MNNEQADYEQIIDRIKNLAITKRLNFLIGSGVSMPAIPIMSKVEGDTDEKKKENLVSEVENVSNNLLNDNLNDLEKVTENNYYDFLLQIIKILTKSNSRQVPKNVNIFTTNYDLFIETAIDKLANDFRFVFNDGTKGYFNRYIESNNFNRVVSYKGLNDNYIDEIPCINLIKPHGSINWEKEKEKIYVRPKVVDNPVIVKPTGVEGEETFLNNHFHDMLRMFQLELDKPQSVLFVIGFSFQDKHIAQMVKRALENQELYTYIFAFNEDDVENIKKNLNIETNRNNFEILSPKYFPIKSEINTDSNTFDITSLTKILEVK